MMGNGESESVVPPAGWVDEAEILMDVRGWREFYPARNHAALDGFQWKGSGNVFPE